MNDNDDPYLAQRVREALARTRTAELGVDVRVIGRGVFLEGSVASEKHRDDLVAVATHAAQGHPVHDDIVVVHGEPDGGIEVVPPPEDDIPLGDESKYVGIETPLPEPEGPA